MACSVRIYTSATGAKGPVIRRVAANATRRWIVPCQSRAAIHGTARCQNAAKGSDPSIYKAEREWKAVQRKVAVGEPERGESQRALRRAPVGRRRIGTRLRGARIASPSLRN